MSTQASPALEKGGAERAEVDRKFGDSETQSKAKRTRKSKPRKEYFVRKKKIF
jgi:predicted ATPase